LLRRIRPAQSALDGKPLTRARIDGVASQLDLDDGQLSFTVDGEKIRIAGLKTNFAAEYGQWG
jgi:hypothetical protein